MEFSFYGNSCNVDPFHKRRISLKGDFQSSKIRNFKISKKITIKGNFFKIFEFLNFRIFDFENRLLRKFSFYGKDLRYTTFNL
jgi:hypothetical protein